MHVADTITYHYANNYTLNISDAEIINSHDVLYDVPVGLVVLLSVFYGTISVLAVIGNSLVIWIVLTTKQMQTITNMFIANLALADVIIAMFAIPFQFQAAVLQRWNLPDFMCPFCPFVQLLSVNVSVFTLTAIAVDRHRAIINPLRARTSKNISKFVISAIWTLSFSLAAPMLVALRVEPVSNLVLGENNDTYVNVTKPFCQVVNFEQSEMLFYRYILTLVQYFVPLCVISFVYIQMAFRLWGSKTPGNAQDSRDITMLKNKKKVIKMLIIVVALFGICWFPLQLYNILHVTWPEVNQYRYINIIWFICDWLAMSNSCYNPFIYGIYNEKFKREFHKRFPFRGRGQGGYHQDQSIDKTLSIFTRVSSVRSSYATSSIRNKHATGRPAGAIGGFGTGTNFYHQQALQYKTTNLNNQDRSPNGRLNNGPPPWDSKGCSCRKSTNSNGSNSASVQLLGAGTDSAFPRNEPDCPPSERKLINGTGTADKIDFIDIVSLNHPHPDSADDGEVDDENGQNDLNRRQQSVASGDRFHLYCNNLQTFKLYD
ncbi:RYamide receptor [Culex pipiens pallens]|uniref:RYamide receptor n=1 Tax=Culex pipiens pallens TaxID=42434 RepID=UPI001953EED9|nr:RYamide receptor [Culex pipiens pallens]